MELNKVRITIAVIAPKPPNIINLSLIANSLIPKG